MKSLQQTLQQNRALQCSTSASLCPAPDVELYSSTALQSALHLYSSTALYTLHPLHPPSGGIDPPFEASATEASATEASATEASANEASANEKKKKSSRPPPALASAQPSALRPRPPPLPWPAWVASLHLHAPSGREVDGALSRPSRHTEWGAQHVPGLLCLPRVQPFGS